MFKEVKTQTCLIPGGNTDVVPMSQVLNLHYCTGIHLGVLSGHYCVYMFSEGECALLNIFRLTATS